MAHPRKCLRDRHGPQRIEQPPGRVNLASFFKMFDLPGQVATIILTVVSTQ